MEIVADGDAGFGVSRIYFAKLRRHAVHFLVRWVKRIAKNRHSPADVVVYRVLVGSRDVGILGDSIRGILRRTVSCSISRLPDVTPLLPTPRVSPFFMLNVYYISWTCSYRTCYC